MPDKKKTSKGQLGEASKLENVSREFLPEPSEAQLDAKQAAISTRRRQGGPVLDDQVDESAEDEDTGRSFLPDDDEVPPTDLEEPE
ncbi:MAG: hypothetical protein R3301_05410 [Saprospiraceae bacterium]|nr:hypothetical protein [Saprospiraceae bacterium]